MMVYEKFDFTVDYRNIDFIGFLVYVYLILSLLLPNSNGIFRYLGK